jgi:hypothetical protein
MNYKHLPVVRFIICEDDQRLHDGEIPDDCLDFEQADELLNKLREKNPGKFYTMVAEVDA